MVINRISIANALRAEAAPICHSLNLCGNFDSVGSYVTWSGDLCTLSRERLWKFTWGCWEKQHDCRCVRCWPATLSTLTSATHLLLIKWKLTALEWRAMPGICTLALLFFNRLTPHLPSKACEASHGMAWGKDTHIHTPTLAHKCMRIQRAERRCVHARGTDLERCGERKRRRKM